MTLWIAWRNLRARLAATALTLLVVALATATALVVPLVSKAVERGAADAAQVFDLLIAAKGSPSQAVLSSLFYLQTPIGNIPYRLYEDLARDPRTRRAVPLGFGDNVRGFPLVGTNARFFEQRLKPTDPPYFRLTDGRLFGKPFEAVLGAQVAAQSGLKLGDSFRTAHGQFEPQGAEREEHAAPYTVVGRLAPTGGPVDRAVLVDLASLWETHGQFAPASRGVTAVLYTGNSLSDLYNVARGVNAGSQAQAVFPGQVFAGLRDVLSQGQAAYAALSLLVLLLAALTVWLSVYAGSLERLRGVSLTRALGGSRPVVFGVVLTETALTVGLGLIAGIVLAYLVAWLGGSVLGARLGFSLPAPTWDWGLAGRVALLFPLGLLAALPPAIQASRQSPLTHL